MNMVLNELQISLIGLGVAAVVVVFAYNKWQETKHRRMAEKIFSADHPDVLLEPRPGDNSDEAAEPRREPVIESPAEDRVPLESVVEPPLPGISEDTDCIVRLDAAEAISAPLLWPTQQDALPRLSRPVQWFGLNEKKGDWDVLNSHSAGRYRILRVALQLVDRRGPVDEADVNAFLAGVGQVANRFLAVIELPTRADVLGRAADLDAFCAGVDVQVAVNVVSREDAGFPGTKLKGVAEAAGLVLGHDGLFHAQDELGRSVYTLGNLEAQMFTPDELKIMTCHAVTLTLDVPRVASGVEAFQRLLHVSGQLATGLHGVVVDDNRVPLDERSATVILSKIDEFQKNMAERGIPAGGPVALRLFA